MSILFCFAMGALGSLLKDILHDGQLQLPKIIDGNFSLGFLGGVIIGGAAGTLIDGNPVTAFLAGYAGTSVINNLILTQPKASGSQKKVVESIIRFVARNENVDPELAVRVAKCESSLSPTAVNTNKDGSRDRGLFQWNEKYHPEITDEIAFDIVMSTRAFCKAFKAGNLYWWDATKKCWDK